MDLNSSHDVELDRPSSKHTHFDEHDSWSGLHAANALLVRWVAPPLVAIAFAGTICVLLGLRRASLPRPHRLLLYTLLGGDLLALAVTTPRNYATTALHVDILAYVPLWLCQFWYALSVAATYLPAYTQLALTVERCLAVVRPLQVRRLFTMRSVVCGLAVTIALICSLALCLTNRMHQYKVPSPYSDKGELDLCHMAPLQGLVLSYVNLALWLIVPLVAMVTCDALIIACLRQEQTVCIHLHPVSRRRAKERRLALILVTLSIVYCAAISPFTIYSTYTSFRSYKDVAVLPLDELRANHSPFSGYLHDDIIWIVTLNCTTAPLVSDWLILVMMSADIRRRVWALFGYDDVQESFTTTPELEMASLDRIQGCRFSAVPRTDSA